jgi:2-dehydropantoate 2-reductase
VAVVVVGGGAVGSFLAWALAAGGQDVWLIRRGHHAGPTPTKVAVTDPEGQRRTAEVTLARAPADVSISLDAIVLATKMYDLADAVTACAAWPSAPIVTVQNGIGAEEMVLQARPEADLIAASLTAAVEPSGDGGWRWMRPGGLGLASVEGGTADLIGDLCLALDAAGLRTRAYDDAPTMKWSKLLGNLVANATAAILDMDAGAIYRHTGLFRIERAQIAEALVVMARLGIRPVALPGADVRLLVSAMRLPAALARPLLGRVVGGARGGKDPSLLIHVRTQSGPSEVEWMNGAVVHAGEGLGIETPVNRRLRELVDEVVADPDRRAWFRGRPDRLVDDMGKSAA